MEAMLERCLEGMGLSSTRAECRSLEGEGWAWKAPRGPVRGNLKTLCGCEVMEAATEVMEAATPQAKKP